MTMYEMKATNVNTNTKMGVLVKMMLLNDHFHDNDTAYICDDKVFSSVGSLSEYLGGVQFCPNYYRFSDSDDADANCQFVSYYECWSQPAVINGNVKYILVKKEGKTK